MTLNHCLENLLIEILVQVSSQPVALKRSFLTGTWNHHKWRQNFRTEKNQKKKKPKNQKGNAINITN